MPPLTVVIGGEEHASDNWSLGGFQLSGELPFTVGAMVKGTLHVDGSDGFEFTAEVVRKDRESGSFGFRFHELTPLAVTKLDRALARRLVSRRRS